MPLNGSQSGLDDLACFQTGGADSLGLNTAIDPNADLLDVGKKATAGNTGSVQTDAALLLLKSFTRNPVARSGAFSANVANSGHIPIPQRARTIVNPVQPAQVKNT